MTSTAPPSCCSARLAKIARLHHSLRRILRVSVAVLSLTSASNSTFADESQVRFVGPPSRLQRRHSSETGAPQESAHRAEVRSAVKWRTEPVPQTTVAASSGVRDGIIAEPVATAPIQKPTAIANLTALQKPLLAAPGSTPSVETIPAPNEPSATAKGGRIKCIHVRPLSAVVADIGLPAGELPADVAAACVADLYQGDTRMALGWAQFDFHWSATCLCHKPLYFEENNAERYGYTLSRVLQPAISGARFFLTIPALPYKMVVERPCDCIYTLGTYRSGDCAPRRWNRLPLRIGAAAMEVGTIAGLILLIP